MNAGIIASRYATALLKLSQENGSGEVVVAQASAVLDALMAVPDLRRLLSDPSIPVGKKLSLLETACHPERGEGSMSPDLLKFFGLLARNGRIGDISLALKSFEDQYYLSKGIIRGRLILPSEPDSSAKELEGKLKSLIEAKTGKTLRLTTEVDESLIGGFVLEVEDKLLDASVSRQLEKIRTQFEEKNRRIV